MVAAARSVELEAAYASCARDARRHYENFPVASLFVPKPMRPAVAAVYAFARAADDFADEGDLAPARRLALLEGWSERLRIAAAGGTQRAASSGEPANAGAIFAALGDSIRRFGLPVSLLEDLLSAFRQDVIVSRYATWDELLDYCRRSANPVGRLVLRIGRLSDPQLDAWSDDICTALQLANCWQDVEVDRRKGRQYLPDGESLPAAVQRTRGLFASGRPLCDAVRGRLRYELRATWLGGVRILDRIEQRGFDRSRPSLGLADAPWLAVRLLAWRTR